MYKKMIKIRKNNLKMRGMKMIIIMKKTILKKKKIKKENKLVGSLLEKLKEKEHSVK